MTGLCLDVLRFNSAALPFGAWVAVAAWGRWSLVGIAALVCDEYPESLAEVFCG